MGRGVGPRAARRRTDVESHSPWLTSFWRPISVPWDRIGRQYAERPGMASVSPRSVANGGLERARPAPAAGFFRSASRRQRFPDRKNARPPPSRTTGSGIHRVECPRGPTARPHAPIPASVSVPQPRRPAGTTDRPGTARRPPDRLPRCRCPRLRRPAGRTDPSRTRSRHQSPCHRCPRHPAPTDQRASGNLSTACGRPARPSSRCWPRRTTSSSAWPRWSNPTSSW